MKKTSLSLCAAALLLSMTACNDKMDPNDPQSVRKYLEKQQIAVSANNFVNAAANSDTSRMTLFLQAAFEIDASNDAGNNAVAIAVNKGNLEILNWLFAHGAKANVTNSNGETVLDNAVAMGHKEVVARLLEQLKAENVPVDAMSSAVLFAAKTGKADMLQILGDAGLLYLLSKKVDVNIKCKQGYSVLDWAKNEGYTRLIKEVQKAGGKNTPAYIKEFGR